MPVIPALWEAEAGRSPEEIRKVVQSLEQTVREILTPLQGVHQGAGFQDIPKRCLKAQEHFGSVKTHLTSMKTKFPAEQYYKFHEHRRFVLQRLVFLAAFVVYLETETLVTREAVTEILGIEPDWEKGFHLDVEDYLSGVLILASELVSSVICCFCRCTVSFIDTFFSLLHFKYCPGFLCFCTLVEG
uniref:Uncharacterized protein n=1 Tax=Saimiri boliviensis boliviensis TaxID=39432 RepID=A0A2K6S778_SAIBB